MMTNSPIDTNALLEPWTGPFESPPFDRFEPRQFPPAFDAALEQARAEIDGVAANPEPPSFANTIDALERGGRSLDRVASVFFNLVGAHTNDELQAIEREIAPKLARHRSETYLNEALFKRVDALKADAAKLALSAEQARVLDRYHLDWLAAPAFSFGLARGPILIVASEDDDRAVANSKAAGPLDLRYEKERRPRIAPA